MGGLNGFHRRQDRFDIKHKKSASFLPLWLSAIGGLHLLTAMSTRISRVFYKLIIFFNGRISFVKLTSSLLFCQAAFNGPESTWRMHCPLPSFWLWDCVSIHIAPTGITFISLSDRSTFGICYGAQCSQYINKAVVPNVLTCIYN